MAHVELVSLGLIALLDQLLLVLADTLLTHDPLVEVLGFFFLEP